MASLEQEIEVVEQFQSSWRSIGWWAETYFVDGQKSRKIGAALFSPYDLERMLEKDHKDALAVWQDSPRCLRSSVPPELPIYPSRYYMDERNWAVARTATQACGRAIIIARELYQGEMPTVEQFRSAVQNSTVLLS